MRHDADCSDGSDQANEPVSDCIPYCGPRAVELASCLVSGPLFKEPELDAAANVLASMCGELLVTQPSHFLVSIAIQAIMGPDSIVATHIIKRITADPGVLRLFQGTPGCVEIRMG